MAIQTSSFGNHLFARDGSPSIQAFYGPYIGTIDNAIQQVNDGWITTAGAVNGVPIGFKFGVVNPTTNEFTEYVVYKKTSSDGKTITQGDLKICAGKGASSGGEGGSTVEVDPKFTSGTDNENPLIATVTIDRSPVEIYAPSSGSISINSNYYDSTRIAPYLETAPNSFDITTAESTTTAPSLKLFATLAFRVAQLEYQLKGIQVNLIDPEDINNINNNNGN